MKTFLLSCMALTFFMIGFVTGMLYQQRQQPDIIAQLAEIKID